MTSSIRRSVVPILIGVLFSVVNYQSSAFADCQATITMTQLGTGGVKAVLFGQGSCFCCTNNGGAVGLFLKKNDGPFVGVKNCPDGPCTAEVGEFFSCGNEQEWTVKAECAKQIGPNDCDFDTPGTQTKSLHLDHSNSLSAGDAAPSILGVLHVHAPDAWTDRSIYHTRLLANGTTEAAGAQGVGSPTLDDVDVNFSVSIPEPGGTLVATLASCSDTFASAVLADSNHCGECDSKLPPECQGCVARPIQLSNGNMRMSDTDPLPSLGGVPMKRTYDSAGPSSTWFGTGWSSMFDRALYIYPPMLDGQYIMIWLDGTKRYIFRERQGTIVQMWPLGTQRATLTVDGVTGAYTLREPNRDIEIVMEPQTGLPVTYRSRSTGRYLSISYSGTTPTHVSDSWGNFGWTIAATAHRIDSMTIDGTALTWQYVYNGGALTVVNGPGGAEWRSYSYSGNYLTEARDGAGNVIESHTYDGFGRAKTSLQDEGDIVNIDYTAPPNSFERVAKVWYASGARTDYHTLYVAGRARTVQIDGNCSSCGTNDAVFGYKPADFTQAGGQLLRMQDARGYITVWTYDSADRVASVSNAYKPSGCDPETDPARCRLTPASLLTLPISATSATETTSYAYADSNWPDRPTTTTRSSVANPGHQTTQTLTYDAVTGDVLTDTVQGYVGTQLETHVTTTVLYDGTEGAAFAPGGPFASGWQTLPQPAGLRKSVDGPRTDVNDLTQWVYYPVNAAVPAFWRGHLAAVRNPAGHITRFESYDALGNATRVVDPNGVATEYTYDAAGRVLTTTLKAVAGCDTSADPLCATDLVTSRTYHFTYGPLASETRSNGGTTTYEYDARGRLLAMTRPVSASLSERIEYSYDAGTGKKSAERYLSGQGSSWTLARSEAFRYDPFGRLIAVDHPDSTSMLYTYDAAGNVATVRDENHTTANTTYKYDPVNRLSLVTQKLSTAPGGTITTQYAYDLHGNLTTVTDPNGNITTYAFDDFGRMKQQVSPVTGTTTYTYDLSGNLLTTTDANAATTLRSYDVLGRVTSATSSRTGLPTEQVAYTYDQNVCEWGNGLGRVSTMSDPVGVTTYCYDRRGLLTKTTDGLGYTLRFGYDAEGNRASMVYPSGRTVTYTFDRSNRPISATMDGTPIVTAATYRPFGPASEIAFGNGTTRTSTFDNRYRPVKNKLTAPSSTLAEYDYVNDAVGNITQIHDAVDATYNRDFGYDDLNRLVTANSGSSLWGAGSYEYDSMGNMKSLHLGSQQMTFAYVGSTPKLQSVTYDGAGNEVVGDNTVYSARNLLARVGSGFGSQGQWVDYGYDGRGVRVSASQHTSSSPYPTARHWIYTPELELLTQGDVSGFQEDGAGRLTTLISPIPVQSATDTDYIRFGGQPVAQASSDPEVPLRFTFTDILGTPLLQTESAANVVWRAEYEPYGTVHSYRAGASDDPQILRFPGQELDAFVSGLSGSDLSYNIFRWYRAGWGRYTQSDPIELLPGPNLYSYTFGNPIRYSDRFGLFRAPMPTPTVPYPQTLPPPGCSPAPPSWGPGTLGGVGTVLWAFFFDPPALNQTGAELPDPTPGHCRGCPKGAEDDRDDRCYDQWIREDHQCEQWWRGGSKIVQDYRRACKQSAFTRYSECLRHGTPRSPLSPRPDQQ